jgi:hypothetical protein
VSLVQTDDEAGALFLLCGHGGGWRCRRWWMVDGDSRFALQKFAQVA